MIGNDFINTSSKDFVSRDITEGATLVLLIVCLFIFFVAYVQLWQIYCYGHKRGSFQSMFLYLCLFWSGLRATLFSFYIKNSSWSSKTSKLPYFLPFWILFSFPVCLQFFIVCLLNLFFLQVAFRIKSQYAADPRKYLFPLRVAFALVVLLFLAVNISTSSTVLAQASAKNCYFQDIRTSIIIRVCVNNLLFVLCAISLAWCLIKIARSPCANIILPFKGTTVCRSLFVGITIVLLYLSRLVVNLIAVIEMPCKGPPSRELDWYIILDQTELLVFRDPSLSYISYVIIIFIWEILPTSLTLLLFKACRGRCTDFRNHQDDLDHSGRFYDVQSDCSDDEMDYPASCSNAILP